MSNQHLNEYRSALVAAEQKSQDDYDKTIVSLSSGALGISIVFFKDIAGEEPLYIFWLVLAWVFWAISVSSVVLSYFLSRIALRKAIEQTDKNDFGVKVGGRASTITNIVNIASGILFILGVISLIVFATKNMGG